MRKYHILGLSLAVVGLFSCNQSQTQNNLTSKLRANSLNVSVDLLNVPKEVVAGSIFTTELRLNNISDKNLVVFFDLGFGDFTNTAQILSVVLPDYGIYREIECKDAQCFFSFKDGNELRPGNSTFFNLLWQARPTMVPGSGSKISADIFDGCYIDKIPVKRPFLCLISEVRDASTSTVINTVNKSDIFLTSKLGKTTAKSGDEIKHTVMAHNNGPYSSYDNEINYKLDPNLEFISFDFIPPGWYCDEPPAGFGGKVTCKTYIGIPLDIQIQPEIRFTTQIRKDLSSMTKIENSGEIYSPWIDDKDLTNNKIIDSLTVI